MPPRIFPQTVNNEPWGYYRGESLPIDQAAKLSFNGQEYCRYHDPSKRHSFAWCDNKQVVRFEVQPGDNQAWIGGGGHDPTSLERAEIFVRRDTPYEDQHANFDQDYWLSYNFLIEPGAVTFQDPIVLQFHSTDDVGDVASHPPLHFRLRGDRWAVMTVADPDNPNTRPTDYPPEVQNPGNVWTYQRYITPAPLARNIYHRVVVRARFNPLGGQLQVWLNGNEVVNGSYPMGHNDAIGPYVQYGIYRYASAEALAVRYHAVEFGPSSLFARVATPVPTSGLSRAS
jgi:hypothetical protein